MDTAPRWWLIMSLRKSLSNSSPRAASSAFSCSGVSMPGMSMCIVSPFMSIIGALPSAGITGTGFWRSRSQRSIVAISSCCALMMRAARRCTSGLAPCVGAMRAMVMACVWWPIMLYMNSTSASTYGLRRLSARAFAMYAASLLAAPDAGCGAVRLAAGTAGPLHPASAAARKAAASVRWLLDMRFILMGEVLLGDHHVHAHVPVHELGDVRVGRHGRRLIGLCLRDVLRLLEELHHLADRGLRRHHEGGIRPHGDPVGRRLPARPVQLQVLAHDHLDAPLEVCLDRRLVHFAIALGSVAVAQLEQRALDEHRDVERRAGHELLVIEVSRVAAGRVAADRKSVV